MIRGWCPGVHAPMASGDGLLIRVKPFGGRLDATALRALARVAGTHGSGAVELTGRGNLQLRGLTPRSAPLAAAALVQAGLADPDPAREARRNVIAVPPCDDVLVAAIEALLADTPGLAPKFCVAVGDARGDVRVVGNELRGDGGQPALAAAIRDLLPAMAAAASPLGPPPGPPPGLLLGLPFGQTDAGALLRLAGLIGARTLRTTPWRGFLLAGTDDPARFAAAGFITDPDDPRRGIAACIGKPGCASAGVAARADAAILAARGLRDLHVSGCAKGCAHPGAATTLVGAPDGSYALVAHGRAGDRPVRSGLTLDQAAILVAAPRPRTSLAP